MFEFSVCKIMNIFYSAVACFASYAYEYPLLTLILSFITALVLIVNVHLSKLFCLSHVNRSVYDYGPERGPHSWSNSGPNQSPINIDTSLVELLNIRERLMWNHYNDLPAKVTIENNGRTVVLKAKYIANVPTISGADLLQSYTFESLCFHWSFWNTEGSEHTIDCRNFPMEIQATHKTRTFLPCLPTHDSVIIAYLFEISTHNHFLDPIILNLHRIKKPGTAVEIPPFPLAWLCYPFNSGFYSYGGSESVPPCDEGVEWFIYSQPMTISECQLMKFRLLIASDRSSRIIRNSRPVQCLNSNRTVNFNQYDAGGSGTTCAAHISEDYENGDD